MIVTCQQMKAAEERLFATPGAPNAESLMEKAGLGCSQAIDQFFRGKHPRRAILFVGKGNNGGDALVAGRHFLENGWAVDVRFSSRETDLSPLAKKKWEEFQQTQGTNQQRWGITMHPEHVALVDGLLGIGARGALRSPLKELAAEMNTLRQARDTLTFAIDIPSGLDGDTGEPYEGAVVADVTLTIAQVKAGLVADQAINHVGRLALVPLPEIEVDDGTPDGLLITPASLPGLPPRRSFDTHKTQVGRVGIVAGSRGLTGAAVLSSTGALRGGAGLVTVYALEDIYEILATRARPEVMVKPVRSFSGLASENVDVWAVGPGLGTGDESLQHLLPLFLEAPQPVVIDADGLNLLSRHPEALAILSKAPAPRLLTPHPGEMARLMDALGGPSPKEQTRAETVAAFLERCPVNLLYKGARTIVAAPDQPLAYNSTGHPGMATGGIGDVLTGLCAALIGQGLSPYQAAALGSWAVGRSAEWCAFVQYGSAEYLAAMDIAENLSWTFAQWRLGGY